MMTIKKMWFYAALATAICGGAGLGAGAVSYSHEGDVERAVMLAQQRGGFRGECEMTQAEREWKQSRFNNRPTKGF